MNSFTELLLFPYILGIMWLAAIPYNGPKDIYIYKPEYIFELNETQPIEESQTASYNKYTEDLYNAIYKSFKDIKFDKFIMKFGYWEAKANLYINKNGVIEEFLLGTDAGGHAYSLQDNEYVLLDKYFYRSYFEYTDNPLLHPIREKVTTEYRYDFTDTIKDFIINDIPAIPFYDGMQRDHIHVYLELYYIPLDIRKYRKTKKEDGISLKTLNYIRVEGKPLPPIWKFQITRNK